MPEGDTIFRIAWRLRKTLSGERLESAHSSRATPGIDQLAGNVVDEIHSMGKHLLIHFGNGFSVHSHLGMTGSWHLIGMHSQWPKARHRAALQLRFTHCDCVCFSPKLLRIGRRFNIERHPSLQALGPDLLADEPSPQQVISRIRRFNTRIIAETLLNQSVVAGIGNVYKSEVLFLNHIHPQTPVAALEDKSIMQVVRSARELLLRNRQGLRRHTRINAAGARLWVYQRSDQACLECGTQIISAMLGDPPRSTYWCPSCQSLPSSGVK